MAAPDRLNALDNSFLSYEKGNLPMHIGAVQIMKGPAPSHEEFLAIFEPKLAMIPRYRQRIKEVPFRLGAPVWIDDSSFSIDFHVRQVALPAPGTDEQLSKLASQIMDSRLDMSRPLWELWLIEGLDGDRWALLSKVHHAMMDGQTGREVTEMLFETQPDVPPLEPVDWVPEPEPSRLDLMTEAAKDNVKDPLGTLGAVAKSLKSPKEFAEQAAARTVGTVRSGDKLIHTEDFLVGHVGPHRRWTWQYLDLLEIKEVKNRLGGTVNDVLLACITGGLRQLLLSRGVELTEDAAVRTMVPVSMRPLGDRSGGNEVSAVFADLPVGMDSAVAAMESVRKQMDVVKKTGQAFAAPTLQATTPFVPFPLLSVVGRLAARVPQQSIATITTNVPGPQHALYMAGREVLQLIPFVPLGMRMHTAFAMNSYHGGVTVGITADWDAVPDVEEIPTGIRAHLGQLVEAAAA
ncbi:MAG: wax ester/triacylglycerol synthase family O-acyltransferase [Actinobacteria bacterium]|nr:wax ester/triacylglycerol synthase family O-acyltransferase [Actinomycetota bacterium]